MKRPLPDAEKKVADGQNQAFLSPHKPRRPCKDQTLSHDARSIRGDHATENPLDHLPPAKGVVADFRRAFLSRSSSHTAATREYLSEGTGLTSSGLIHTGFALWRKFSSAATASFRNANDSPTENQCPAKNGRTESGRRRLPQAHL